MGTIYDTAELVSQMKDRGFVPTSQGAYTVDRFLAIATQQMWTQVCPIILKAREDFFAQRTKTFAITSGKRAYRIPSRAMNGVVKDVWFENADGGRIPLPIRESAQVALDARATSRGTPEACWIEGGNLILYPTPDASTNTLVMLYHERPNRLVQVSSVGTVTAVGPGSVTVDALPGGSAVGPFDFIQGQPGFAALDIDRAGTSGGGTVINFAGGPPAELVVGDYVAKAGESCVPQIPEGFHLAVALRGMAAMVGALGDLAKKRSLLDEAAAVESLGLSIIEKRIEEKPKSVYRPQW